MFTIRCLLSTTHYSLSTIHYPLFTTHYSLPTIRYPLFATHYSFCFSRIKLAAMLFIWQSTSLSSLSLLFIWQFTSANETISMIGWAGCRVSTIPSTPKRTTRVVVWHPSSNSSDIHHSICRTYHFPTTTTKGRAVTPCAVRNCFTIVQQIGGGNVQSSQKSHLHVFGTEMERITFAQFCRNVIGFILLLSWRSCCCPIQSKKFGSSSRPPLGRDLKVLFYTDSLNKTRSLFYIKVHEVKKALIKDIGPVNKVHLAVLVCLWFR